MFQQIINGLTIGSIYALVALGLTVVFGNLGIVNFAAGEFSMLAAYVMVGLLAAGWPFAIAFVVTVVIIAAGSYVAYRLLYVRTVGRPLTGAIASLGLLVVAQNFMLLRESDTPRVLQLPLSGSIKLFGASLAKERLFAAGFGLLMVLASYMLLNRTMMGRAIRGTMQQRTAARLVGVRTETIMAATFILSGVLLAVAGIVWGGLFSVQPHMGASLLFTGFTVVVIGGLGSISGALVAGLLVGVIEALVVQFIGPGYVEASIGSLLMITVLVIRPTGLFGDKVVVEVARE